MKEFKPTAMPCTEEQWLNEMKPLLDKYKVVYTQLYEDFNEFKFLVNNYCNQNGIVSNTHTCNSDIYDRTLIDYNPAEFIRSMGIEIEEKKELPNEFCFICDKYSKEQLKKLGVAFEKYAVNNLDYIYYVKNNIVRDYKQNTCNGMWDKNVGKDLEPINLSNYIKSERKKWEDKTRGGAPIAETMEFGDKIAVRRIDGAYYFVDKNGLYLSPTRGYSDLIPYNPQKAKIQAEIEQKEKELQELKEKLNGN